MELQRLRRVNAVMTLDIDLIENNGNKWCMSRMGLQAILERLCCLQ